MQLSPFQLLNSRENFRRFSESTAMAHNRRQDIDGVFGVLLTLYHVRKLLSSHGIKPAFEMLEEKLRHGSFVRFVSRNEFLIRAKILMQQYVTHGAPSPKLSKMLDILIDHFKNNDSQCSRVIIFSNFRGSVRDIMNTLAKVGDPVRATEFIGQSSAKTLKGQSQKIQQAVLEKFRSGNFNVIVATSIGEEGLDIMEVDLVICFDANVSPLRMIQRMGRTGRKHEGRVVVLACEGSELKGYLEKKSRNKNIKKHMRNGLNSFNFHSSPRMIPHVIKPEVQLVELSIKQFIHRGKKVKDNQLTHSPAPLTNLTHPETEQIAKYFSSMDENVWMPSLIAFPLFQSYPSQVHNVLHSSRTGMFIDAMQHLQESSLVRGKAFVCEDESSSGPSCVGEDVPRDNVTGKFLLEDVPRENMTGSQTFSELPQKKTPEVNTSYVDTEPKLEPHGKCTKSPRILFGSEFTSMEKDRRIQSLSGSKILSHSRCTEISEIRCASTSSKRYPEEKLLTSGLHNNDVHLEAANPFESIPLVSSPNIKSDEVDRTDGSPLAVTRKTHALDDEPNDDWCDAEISPRLTSFIKSGYVPESPFDIPSRQDYASTPKSHKKLKRKLSLRGDNRKSHTCPPENDISADIVDRIERTVDPNNNLPQRSKFATSLDEDRAPLAQLSNFGNSNDCQLNSGEHSNRYVPESPINDFDIPRSQDYASPPKLHSKVMKKLSLRGDNRKSHTCPSEKDISADILDQIERTVDANNNLPQRCKSATPSAQLSNFSCSNDWQLNSKEHSNGYVPDSPINDSDISKSQDDASTPKSQSKVMKKLSLRGGNRKSHTCPSEKDISADNQIERTVDANDNLPQICKSATSLDEVKSPLAQLSNFSCSNDWKLNSGEHSNSVEKPCKFRRLRKYGDHHKKFSLEKREESETFRKFRGCDKQSRGAKKREKEGFVFIDEEAEVSQHGLMSEDEEDIPDSDSCDDSFIDDRINPTWASTQAEVGGVDMMAVYRRSLLTQSPMVEGQPSLAYVSPDSATPRSRPNEGSSLSRTEMNSTKTLNVGPGSNARIPGSLQMNSDMSSGYAILNSDLSSVNRNDACLETRNRKRSFCQEGSLPVHNLEKEFLYASQSAERNPAPGIQVEKPEDCDMFDDDDQFFANLDLDAVEAQAAQLLRSKAVQKNVAASDVPHPNFDIADLPTFDLGI